MEQRECGIPCIVHEGEDVTDDPVSEGQPDEGPAATKTLVQLDSLGEGVPPRRPGISFTPCIN